MAKKKTILFVAPPDSVHTGRWVKQREDRKWDVHLFPSYEAGPHPLLNHVTMHGPIPNAPGFFHKAKNKCRHFMQKLFPASGDETFGLAQSIRKLRPDMVHSLEMLRGGRLVSRAYDLLNGKTAPWIVTCWGNELYFFGRWPEHESTVKEILRKCDYFLCDCQRDARLSREYGFEKEVLPVQPVGGGYNWVKAQPLCTEPTPSKRTLIVLKGYQGVRGRALFGIRALQLCAKTIIQKRYTVALYSVHDEDVRNASQNLAQSAGIKVEIVPQSSHEDMLRLHGRSRISIGLSLSDGLSNSFLEACLMGAFPIQSDTMGVPEWFHDGENGRLVPPEDPQKISIAIQKALTDDVWVDHAAQINAEAVKKHYDETLIRNNVLRMYETILAERA
ncbi:MAG: glycosyltransferase [Candidatus Omnitrophica bacterium]|nr:glycosyltransferase [Candidatus Omnitrophota bacterium]